MTLSEGLLACFVAPDSQSNTFTTGVIIGAFQWQFLFRNKLTKAGLWVWVTALAWPIGLFLGRFAGVFVNLLLSAAQGTLSEGDIIALDSSPLGFPILIIFHSTVLGILQWLFFMRNRFRRAIWWIPTTILGWSISTLIGWVIIPIVAQTIGWNESGLEDSAIRGNIFGSITGLAIQWLIKQALPSKEDIAIKVGIIS